MMIDSQPSETYGSFMPRRRRAPSFGGAPAPQGFVQGDQPELGSVPVSSVQPMPEIPAPPKVTQDFSWLNQGYSREKLNDSNKQSAKYVMGRTLSAFDPRQGITGDVLKALNSLGYGTFSGGGQHLNLSGLTDAGRGAGLTGDYNGADFIEAFSGGNGRWSYQDPYAEAQAAASDPYASTPPPAMPSTLPLDPSYDLPYWTFGGYGGPMQQPTAAPPQQPSILSDPSFWQSLMGLFGPQPGYSAMAAPTFSGVQRPTQAQAQNPQLMQILSQLMAGLSGGQ